MGALKTLTKRAYDVFSNKELLQKELNYIEKVFRVNNNYPNWVIKNVLQQAKQQQQQQQTPTTTNNSRYSRKELFFITPL